MSFAQTRVRRRVAVVAITLAVVPLLRSEPADAAAPFDGTAPTRAAASCFEIKQLHPASADGIYWLLTPRLEAPTQFYCDMTTDGGGWVLIGRGREGWTFNPNGQRSTGSVRGQVTGTAAFAPAALSTKVIDGLLGGGNVKDLADGVRIRRALDVGGVAYQEVRLHLRDLTSWSWAFGGGHRLRAASFGSTINDPLPTTFTTRMLTNLNPQHVDRMTMYAEAKHNVKGGFAYGSTVRGTNSPTTYLWEYTTEGSALPFAQMWLRPTITQASAGFAPIPDAGLGGNAQRPLPANRSAAMPWGVGGLNVGTGVPNLKAFVTTFAEANNIIYVGGKFAHVQQGASGAPIAQPSLAAFDRATGEWISTFRPTLNGVVWSLRVTPQGRLMVGGEFNTVNGETRTGLVALDPATGAIDPTWGGGVLAIGLDTFSFVKSMDVEGNWLYVTGKFNQITGNNPVRQYSAGRLARFALTTGQPDVNWRPRIDGLAYEIDASAQGDRTWIAGYFLTVNGNPRRRVTALDTATGAEVPGLQPLQSSWTGDTRDHQQTILEQGAFTYFGGSQHNLHQTNRADMALVRPFQTFNGGDFQTIGYDQGSVFASCHCDTWRTWRYADVNKRVSDEPGLSTYTRVDPISFIGAWDAVTFEPITDFHPDLGSVYGTGVWDHFVDSTGCTWLGGDTRPGREALSTWLSGFSKHCPRDSIAPSTPAVSVNRPSARAVVLTWPAVTDDRPGTITYEILEVDRVIATTTSTTYTRFPVEGPAQLFVRAVDAAGNRSATTPVIH